MDLDLEVLYALAASDPDRALDMLFEAVDDALWAGHEAQSWPDVEKFIEAYDPDRATVGLSVGVLSITLPVRTQLEGRAELVAELERRWLLSEGVERTERLLSGLR